VLLAQLLLLSQVLLLELHRVVLLLLLERGLLGSVLALQLLLLLLVLLLELLCLGRVLGLLTFLSLLLLLLLALRGLLRLELTLLLLLVKLLGPLLGLLCGLMLPFVMLSGTGVPAGLHLEPVLPGDTPRVRGNGAAPAGAELADEDLWHTDDDREEERYGDPEVTHELSPIGHFD
jgi:hypothetical protein